MNQPSRSLSRPHADQAEVAAVDCEVRDTFERRGHASALGAVQGDPHDGSGLVGRHGRSGGPNLL